ncbi:MAG: hypothetical protein FD167_5554 [bacterium]|nr:MAG: hypothetical protein FD167_5554 [bacterium]
MVKERKQMFLSRNLIIPIILSLGFTVVAQQETPKKPRVVFTNDEFSTTLPKVAEKDNSSETPKPTPTPTNNLNNNAQAQAEAVPNVDLQFKLLNLQLALAQDPKNQTLREQQIDINTQLRQAPLVKASNEDLRDLAFRQRYIKLKIVLVNTERQIQQAVASIQQERRKIVKGSQGNRAFEEVQIAEGRAEALYKEITKLQTQLDTLMEEGRRLGVSARTFR